MTSFFVVSHRVHSLTLLTRWKVIFLSPVEKFSTVLTIVSVEGEEWGVSSFRGKKSVNSRRGHAVASGLASVSRAAVTLSGRSFSSLLELNEAWRQIISPTAGAVMFNPWWSSGSGGQIAARGPNPALQQKQLAPQQKLKVSLLQFA